MPDFLSVRSSFAIFVPQFNLDCMKQTSIFLVVFLGLVYFMLVTVFCYQLGKTNSFGDALAGLWNSTKALLPVIIITGVAVFGDCRVKRKNIR